MKRRGFLLTAGAIAGAAGLGAAGLSATGLVSGVGPRKASMPYDLIVQKARYKFTDQSTLGMVAYYHRHRLLCLLAIRASQWY